MGGLTGKACLVTGGSRGIGRAVALELDGTALPWPWATRDDTERGAEQVAAEIAASGGESFVFGGESGIRRPPTAVASVVERFGKIDVLVNNAGITRDRSLAKMSHEEWDAVIQTNLTSVFNLTARVLPLMVQAGYGRIVNISSVIGVHGNFGQANYAAAKAGIIGFTKAAALEVARKGVTVNALAPGFIETEMIAAMPEEVRAKILARIPMGRFGRPEEIAQAVFFLVSTGDYITGQVITIDGGMYTYRGPEWATSDQRLEDKEMRSPDGRCDPNGRNGGVYLVSAARTPIGKFAGALADVPAVELGGVAIRAAFERSGLPAETPVDEVLMGQVLQAGAGQAPARQATLRRDCPSQRVRRRSTGSAARP